MPPASDVDEEGETDGEVVHLLGLLILNGSHVVGVFGEGLHKGIGTIRHVLL